MISLGTYRSAVPARRTQDMRLPDNQANLRAHGVQVRRASGSGRTADGTRPAQGASARRQHLRVPRVDGRYPAMRPRPHRHGHGLVNSDGGFDRNSGQMIVQQRLLYRRSACITIHAWQRAQTSASAARRVRTVRRVPQAADGRTTQADRKRSPAPAPPARTPLGPVPGVVNPHPVGTHLPGQPSVALPVAPRTSQRARRALAGDVVSLTPAR